MRKYEVKKGDTIHDISKRKGVSPEQVTGFRSGDPDLIYPGEKLTVGGVADDIPKGTEDLWGGIQEQFGGLQERTGEMTPEQAERFAGIEEQYRGLEDRFGPKDPGGLYGMEEEEYTEGLEGAVTGDESEPITETLEQEIRAAQLEREKVREDLENSRVELFNKEYEDRELGQTKERIDQVDETVSSLRKEREDAILQARRNPNISAGVLAGETQKLTEYYNNQINNEIQKRNSLAEQYNRGLDEVDRNVENRLGDLKLQYDHWGGVIEQASGDLDRYQEALRNAWESEREEERWASEMAQQLQIALLRAMPGEERDRLEILQDPITGEPIGLINPYTGKRFPITEGEWPAEDAPDSEGMNIWDILGMLGQGTTDEWTEPEEWGGGFMEKIRDYFR